MKRKGRGQRGEEEGQVRGGCKDGEIVRDRVRHTEREIAKKMIEAEVAAARKTLELEKQIGTYEIKQNILSI